MSERNYTKLEQLFHQIVLSGRATPEIFFDIEKVMYANKCSDPKDGRHVFVSGLARAGTTVLMRMLHDSGQFASLTYRDMPLVMAPNVWRKFSGGSQKSKDREERAHGDGLLVGYDSPEALEEVFWRTFCGPEYIQKTSLTPMQADEDTIDEFRQYVGLILNLYGHKRYLSKNNNSILRLGTLATAFPHATIIIPFRDPIAHSISLLRQHERFLETHAASTFSRRYMTWLAHHEFGADHRRFEFSGVKKRNYGDASDLSYWLDLWIDAHQYLSQQADRLGTQVIFFSYERLIKTPEDIREKLYNLLDLTPCAPLEIKPGSAISAPALERIDEARELYTDLDRRAGILFS